MGAASRGIKSIVAALVVITVLAACVEPVPPTPIPTATIAPTPTAPPPVGPSFPSAIIGTWLAGAGVVPNNLSLFTQLQAGPDDIVGFTYQDANAQTCVGFVLATAATGQIWNGDYRCLAAGAAVVISPLLFALTNNEFYVATYGYVDPTRIPNINAVAIVFPDGSSLNQMLLGNAFIVLRQGLDFPNQAVIIDPNGFTQNLPIPS